MRVWMQLILATHEFVFLKLVLPTCRVLVKMMAWKSPFFLQRARKHAFEYSQEESAKLTNYELTGSE